MAKKTPKYNTVKEIVKDIDFAIAHAQAAHDPLMESRLESIRKRIVKFDNDMWTQTEKMSEYLPM